MCSFQAHIPRLCSAACMYSHVSLMSPFPPQKQKALWWALGNIQYSVPYQKWKCPWCGRHTNSDCQLLGLARRSWCGSRGWPARRCAMRHCSSGCCLSQCAYRTEWLSRQHDKHICASVARQLLDDSHRQAHKEVDMEPAQNVPALKNQNITHVNGLEAAETVFFNYFEKKNTSRIES